MRQYTGEQATIDGDTGSEATNIIQLASGGWVTFRDFEVKDSVQSQTSTASSFNIGVPGIKLINLVIHDCSYHGIGHWTGSPNSETYGCILYYNGRWTDAPNNNAYNVYTQNLATEGEKPFIDNIMFKCWGAFNIHNYTQTQGRIENFRWDGNTFFCVGATGTANYSGGTFTIEGSGADISGTADEFQFVYRNLYGDGEITARVAGIENTNSLAKAGVMIRESLTAGSRNGADLLTPVGFNKARFQRRTSAGGTTASSSNSADVTAPYWLRLNRTGNTFKAYISTNGTSWTQFGSNRTITMTTNVYIGLVVCSHNDGTLCTATFDNVSVTE